MKPLNPRLCVVEAMWLSEVWHYNNGAYVGDLRGEPV